MSLDRSSGALLHVHMFTAGLLDSPRPVAARGVVAMAIYCDDTRSNAVADADVLGPRSRHLSQSCAGGKAVLLCLHRLIGACVLTLLDMHVLSVASPTSACTLLAAQ